MALVYSSSQSKVNISSVDMILGVSNGAPQLLNPTDLVGRSRDVQTQYNSSNTTQVPTVGALDSNSAGTGKFLREKDNKIIDDLIEKKVRGYQGLGERGYQGYQGDQGNRGYQGAPGAGSQGSEDLYWHLGATQEDKGDGNTISTGYRVYAPEFYQSSDERLKIVRAPVGTVLPKIAKLPIFLFNWKNNPTGEVELGTSAQEVQKICPQIVDANKEGRLAINYSKLSLLAIKAIQELLENKK